MKKLIRKKVKNKQFSPQRGRKVTDCLAESQILCKFVAVI